MKKTVTINISGTVFHIDEDAYQKLKDYLAIINNHFKKEEGGQEIVNDIEARIAELFAQRILDAQEVVNLEMVETIVSIMGLPEDFMDAEENEVSEGKKSSETPYQPNRQNRRLYRDPDSRVLGGVCSGLAHYLRMDKVLARVLMFILIPITSGAAILIYLILWLAVPKARTTSQKLEMRGESINVGSIGKTVKEEFSEMKENFDQFKQSREYQKGKEYARKAGQGVQQAGKETVNVFAKIFGAIFFFIGILSLVGLIIGTAATSRMLGFLPEFIPGGAPGILFNHFYSGSLATTLLIASFLIAVIPLLLLIYAGSKMLFNYVSNNRNIVLSSLGVWIIAIVVAIASVLGAIDVFSSEASFNETAPLTSNSDTLYLSSNQEAFIGYSDTRYEFNNVMVMMKGNEEILVSRPRFNIEPATGSDASIKIKKTSKGNNYREAKNNAESIVFAFAQTDTSLLFNPYFTLDEPGKWRAQKVKITLYLPLGKTVYLDEKMLPIIYDIENTSNTWDGDMVGKYWTMTPEGLSSTQTSYTE